jgi:hypothetical protein
MACALVDVVQLLRRAVKLMHGQLPCADTRLAAWAATTSCRLLLLTRHGMVRDALRVAPHCLEVHSWRHACDMGAAGATAAALRLLRCLLRCWR